MLILVYYPSIFYTPTPDVIVYIINKLRKKQKKNKICLSPSGNLDDNFNSKTTLSTKTYYDFTLVNKINASSDDSQQVTDEQAEDDYYIYFYFLLLYYEYSYWLEENRSKVHKFGTFTAICHTGALGVFL